MALGDKHVITGRYYNANYYATVIVAVITEGIDWTAYIGGARPDIPETAAAYSVSQTGCKLSESDAKHYFSGFPFEELRYRK